MSTTLDCEVLGDLFGTEELRRVFDSRSLVQAWLDVERALAEAGAEVGLVPTEAAERIAQEADVSRYSLDNLRAGIAESQHPLVPLVRALAERCDEHGRYVHWGATTQDVMDTGAVLQIRQALVPITRDLERAIVAAAELARRHAGTVMAGRTHGQHAVPITFGLKAASWTDQLLRCQRRLDQARTAVLTAQLAGAAGTLAALGDDARPVRAAFCRLLDLAEADVPWHTDRSRFRDLGHALSEIAAAAERIASEVIRLQATEVEEVAEPLTDTHVGSSTMPQKRNPMTSEYIVSLARLLRAAAGVLVDSAAHAHERAMGEWAAEWIALPQALILTGGLLAKLAPTLEGLAVDPERMRANLQLSRGSIMAEATMMELARRIGHERAHEVITVAARRAALERRDFADVLAHDADVTAVIGPGALKEILDPLRYLGLAEEVAMATASAAEAGAASDVQPVA